jgi:hypothetical protein
MNGTKILTATHTLSSADRAIRKNFNTLELLETIANRLRLMGEGTKAWAEKSLMTLHARLILANKNVVVVG